MPPKAAIIMTPGESGPSNDASMAETLEDSQIVTMGQLRKIMD